MHTEDITIEDFLKYLSNGQKVFQNIAVENYEYTLKDTVLDGIEFHLSFVNINFENCSFKNTKFIACNLKCIIFQNCDLTGCTISDCAIEDLVINDCNTDRIEFGTNYAYGNTLSSDDCLQILIKKK